MTTATAPDRVLRLREVMSIVGLSKTTVYAWMKDGGFPQAISLGGRSVGWLESEVHGWLAQRIAESRAPES